MNKFTYLIAVVLVAFAAVAFHELQPTAQPVGSTVTQGPYLEVATTSTSVAVTVSARLIATTTNPLDPSNSYNRIYATFCNTSSNPVYISFNGDKPATRSNAQVVIAAAAGYNACFALDDTNAYNGSVTASSTNETSTTIQVSQYVK